MTELTLTKTQLRSGIWEGELSGAGETEPNLTVTHLGEAIDGLELTQDAAHDVWRVSVPVPLRLISDGVQTFIISDEQNNTLDSFTLISGRALAEDMRAEIALLRSELDMLKQSFRRHCKEV
jgi:hypothetical protein